MSELLNEEAAEKAKQREETAKRILAGFSSVAIAYSGGVDSAYLADLAHEVLGKNLLLILAVSPSMPREEIVQAKALAEKRGWNLLVIESNEFEIPGFVDNSHYRCYYCKAHRFDLMQACARERKIAVVLHGENLDDRKDTTRLGAMAAEERHVRAPLQEASLTKDEIRWLSKQRGLPTWNKPATACLATRVPLNTRLEPQILTIVEQAEDVLRQAGLRQYRARHHGDLCRIEIGQEEFDTAVEPRVRAEIVSRLHLIGYKYIALDLEGYVPPGDD